MSDSYQPVLELRHVSCGSHEHAARDCSARFSAGTLHLINGDPARVRSILRVIGLLDPPGSGEVHFETRDVTALDDRAREDLRNQRCGFLFAAPFLLPGFSVVENVAMPLFKISRFTPEQARARTDLLLDFVGLAPESQCPVEELTPFKQHAVSLARALANDPAVITVESLDGDLSISDTADFAALLRRCCARFGVAIIAAAPIDFPVKTGDRILAIDELGTIREWEARPF